MVNAHAPVLEAKLIYTAISVLEIFNGAFIAVKLACLIPEPNRQSD